MYLVGLVDPFSRAKVLRPYILGSKFDLESEGGVTQCREAIRKRLDSR
jgi:hypothetical protein